MRTLLLVYLFALIAGVVWQNLSAVEAATPSKPHGKKFEIEIHEGDYRKLDLSRKIEEHGYPVLTQ